MESEKDPNKRTIADDVLDAAKSEDLLFLQYLRLARGISISKLYTCKPEDWKELMDYLHKKYPVSEDPERTGTHG
jgi:hypothetical protein